MHYLTCTTSLALPHAQPHLHYLTFTNSLSLPHFTYTNSLALLHAPPHFHAEYGEYEGVFDIQTQATIRGSLPPRARGLVAEWGAQHEAELLG